MVKIELSDDEALVLFDWLATLNNKDDKSSFSDQSEQRILFDIEASLESSLSSVISANYFENLKAARDNVRDRE